MPQEDPAGEQLLAGERVVFRGKLGGLPKRDASQLVRQHGGVPLDRWDESATILVLGADQLPLVGHDSLDEAIRSAQEDGRLQILTETEFWEQLGLLDRDTATRRLYTPAMLADLLRVPVTTIRRWHRRGLIAPVREVHRLPYFDFQEVATARRLAGLLADGVSPDNLERQLAAAIRLVPGMAGSLRQLAVIVEGGQVLLRHEEGLLEPSGQRRFDFDAIGKADREAPDAAILRAGLSVPDAEPAVETGTAADPETLRLAAIELEEQGQLELAAETYRSALAAGGPNAEVCFQLAELLYRLGEVTAARERYYMVLELDEDFVEARSSLGCVLAELGELDLAVAALQGALSRHSQYADAHYHLARTLGELGREPEARHHWEAFLELAPDSPWADEGRLWLQAPHREGDGSN